MTAPATQPEALLSRLAKHHPDADAAVVSRAFELVQARYEGREPEAVKHALDTAEVLARLRLDPSAVAASLTARAFIEGALPLEQVTEALGEDVARLLAGVQRLASIRWDRIEEEAAETLREMFLAMARDVRVVMIVLAMRVQRIRAIREETWSQEERQRYARETLDVFAPLANRLGIWQLKWELEDFALRELEPDTYAEIKRLLAERRDERQAFIDQVVAVLEEKLAEEGIEASIKGRAKHIYSIYKKMQRKDLEFDQLYDLRAVRVITKRLQDCYGVLGLVHSTFVPIPSEFDDYVAKPKDNGYQSLHTAVIGPGGRPVEVQIRTEQMHQLSEFGVAAHWAYKEGGGGKGPQDKFMLLRQLMDWEREVSDPHQFIESLKTDIFEDQVYVFTPAGDVIDLPVGATPLDFAYRVHTMVGHRCRGAKINGRIVPLETGLKTGDRVEVLTHKEPQPSRDWMNPTLGFLKTASARSKVRAFFRKQGRGESIRFGKEMVERELARLDLAHATIEEIATALDYPTPDDLYAAVGYGDRNAHSVSSAALTLEREKAPPEPPRLPSTPPPPPTRQTASGLRIDGSDEVMGRRARCCSPVPGDDVVGFVTRGRGVVIHHRRCPNILGTPEPERLVEIDWGEDAGQRHAVEILVQANDRAGLMGELSKLVTAIGVNIQSARAESDRGKAASIRLSLDCRSADQVAQVIDRIGRHRDVLEVRRVGRR
ncbi:MAG: bifunctional (p)ppGpp synthetase/guanosine-3',5'-bis(diphosphate) 3'-pyrophosphohydrolase [Sandaracinaceae bacterium]|nr:MAG: bifunctional (p)ppGpp synthetase/guanosine-3',5'-bis(diphosphate) 3'-pyrophosphohydrolase [Sandaracinaceae bacterium]